MHVFSVAQLCLTLYDSLDCSPPGCSLHGIFQTRKLEWVAISYSRGSSLPRDRTCVSCIAGSLLHWLTDSLPLSNMGSPLGDEYGFSGGSGIKNPPAMHESLLQCRRHRFDSWFGMTPLEKEMATESSFLAWEIPWTEEPGGMWSS